MQTKALLATRTRTAGYVGWPRTLRGASAGHSSRTGRNTIDRPSRARKPTAGNGKQSNQPVRRATWCHSPGQVAGKPFVSCRGRARPAPWTRKACVHSPSSLPPRAPIPPDWRCHPSCGPQLKFEGKGGLRAPCGKDYPPKPPAKERPNQLGGTRPRQDPSLAGRQEDGGGTRRPGSAPGDPPP